MYLQKLKKYIHPVPYGCNLFYEKLYNNICCSASVSVKCTDQCANLKCLTNCLSTKTNKICSVYHCTWKQSSI